MKWINRYETDRIHTAEKTESGYVAESAAELQEMLRRLHITGRTITDIRTVGTSYLHTPEWPGNECDPVLNPHAAVCGGRTEHRRCMLLDEPLLLTFSDGETLIVETPWSAAYKLQKCRLSSFPHSRFETPNVDAAVLLAPSLGKNVLRTEIHTVLRGTEASAKSDAVDSLTVVLRFEDESALVLCAAGGYLEVSCTDRRDRTVSLSDRELRESLADWRRFCADTVTSLAPLVPVLKTARRYFGSASAAPAAVPTF